MKAWLILILAFTGCATSYQPEPISPTRNLTEAEIRSLPSGIDFDGIHKLLRYYDGCEISIPVIFFPVEDRDNQQCGMFFDEKNGRLLWAAMAPIPIKDEIVEGVMLWPKEIAGMKTSEFILKQKKTEPNQSPETTTMAVTPAASHPSRQP